MKKTLKKILPPACIHLLQHITGFFRALLGVRLDFHDLKEKLQTIDSRSQSLGKGNFEFYSNFFRRICSNHVGFFVVDVGANDGWFARLVFRFAPEASVLSFEPLRSQHARLAKMKTQFSQYDYRVSAVGDCASMVRINEYETSGLSSVLKLNNSEYQYAGDVFGTKVVAEYEVECVPLDKYAGDFAARSKALTLLKIDTQGYELKVLQGATDLLRSRFFDYVLVEILTVEKYEKAPSFLDIFTLLASHGYHLADIHPSYREANGWLTEFDCVFSKKAFAQKRTPA
jgi:FkbM family methyltransferase